MQSSTYLARVRRLILLGAVVAGIVVPAAAGSYNGSPPDVRDAAAAGLYNGSPPDVRDAAAAAKPQAPDILERYAAEHPYGAGLSLQSTPVDRIIAQEQGRRHDPGLFSLGLASRTASTLVSRPPDVSDAAAVAGDGVSTAQSSGFDWGDWAIGVGAGIGIALLLGIGLVVGRQQRHRVQPA